MLNRSQTGSAVSGAVWMVAFRMFSRGIGVASTLILARLLTKDDFGLISIAFTISAALSSITNVGVAENLVRFKEIDRTELDTGFTIQFMRGVMTGIVLFFTASLIAKWFSEPRLSYIICVMAVIFGLVGFENIAIIKFRRNMQFDREFKLSVVERIIAFLGTIITAVISHSYWALIVGMLLGKVTRVVASYIMEPYRPRLSLQAWNRMAGFSLWMWASSLVYIIWIRADPLVIGSQISKAMLGIYVLALDIALLPTTEIMEPIGAVLFAKFASQHSTGEESRLDAFSLSIALSGVMLPIALLLSAGSNDIVAVLLGSSWTEAAPIVSILAFCVIVTPVSNVAAQSLTASGRVQENLAVVLSASIFKVVVLYLGARTGDLETVAFSALCVSVIEAACFIIALHRNGSRVSGLYWSALRFLLSTLISALCLKMTGLAWNESPQSSIPSHLFHGGVLGIVGSVSYVLSIVGFWLVARKPDGPERLIIDVVLSSFSSR